MTASSRHWRILIGAVAALIVAAFAAPAFLPVPGMMENRVLAAPPAFPRTFDEAARFRRAADAYIADQFPLRAHLIAVLNRVRMAAGVSGSGRVIVGRDGYLFFDTDDHLGPARGDPVMTPAEERRWLEVLAGRTEALRSRGARYLVVIAPVKETMFPQKGPAWYAGPGAARPAMRLPFLARRTGAGEAIYLHDAVAAVERPGAPTYTRYDTHWTGHGAYGGYAALLTKLKAMGVVGDAPLAKSRFRIKVETIDAVERDLALMLGVGNLVGASFPKMYGEVGAPPPNVTYLTPRREWTAPQVVDTGARGKPTLLMTRDSFSTELVPMLYPHFSRIILAHDSEGFWRQDLIDRFSPDVVILEVIESNLRFASEAGPAPSQATKARIAAYPMRDGTPGGVQPLNPTPARLKAGFARAAHSDKCGIDTATLSSAADDAIELYADGWLWAGERWRAGGSGWVRIEGPGVDLARPVRFDRERPDVATAVGQRAAHLSGFAVQLRGIARAPGPYSVTVFRRHQGGLIRCAFKKVLGAP